MVLTVKIITVFGQHTPCSLKMQAIGRSKYLPLSGRTVLHPRTEHPLISECTSMLLFFPSCMLTMPLYQLYVPLLVTF